jgi:cellulose synthase/poly-beta-1,6-N-acetylglucosamine synthase-like glycosyltransferase
MLNIILIFIGICTILAEFFTIGLWINARWQYKKERDLSYSPKTCIIIPCKYAHERFKENVNAIINQEYKNYNVIFVTDSTEDSAYKVVKEIVKDNKKIHLETADSIKGCSGKIAALIKGVGFTDDAEVYVFADSDIKPHKQWLKYLVGYLDDEEIGATTGYRWYFPNNLKSYFISTWNLTSVLPFFFPMFNYTWGGSTAMKKKVFDKLNVAEKWKKGFADDLILTEALKKEEYKIKFVPKCLIENSAGDEGNFLKWGTRQFTWVKWYYPFEYTVSFLRVVGVKVIIILGIILLYLGYTIPGLLMISSFFLEIIAGWQAISTVKNLMFYPKKSTGSSLVYTLLMPFALFVIAFNYISSLFTREVFWSGRKYNKREALSKKMI